QVRQQRRRDAHVIIDHLPLGESSFGKQHLIEVRKLQVPSLDVNYSLFGHCVPRLRCTEMMQFERASVQPAEAELFMRISRFERARLQPCRELLSVLRL